MKPEWMQRGLCYRCSYDVRGLPAGTCPECGTQLSRGAYEHFLAKRSRVDRIILSTMVVTGVGAVPISMLATVLPRPEVCSLVLASALSLVAAVASCLYFIRVLARRRSFWFGLLGVVVGLATWAAMTVVSYFIAVTLASTTFEQLL